MFANVRACALGAPQPNLTGDAETGTDGWSFLSETQACRHGGGTQPHRWRGQTSQSRGTVSDSYRATGSSIVGCYLNNVILT